MKSCRAAVELLSWKLTVDRDCREGVNRRHQYTQATIDVIVVGASDNFAASQPINLIDQSWLAVPSNYLELIIALKASSNKALSE
jgi:hypothetical protein